MIYSRRVRVRKTVMLTYVREAVHQQYYSKLQPQLAAERSHTLKGTQGELDKIVRKPPAAAAAA